MNQFEMMGLPKHLLTQLAKKGLSDPTPIQLRAIPKALEGDDVMGLAQTGTGKTLAFGLPLMAVMLGYGKKPLPKTVRGLVLAPTRELATQIRESLWEMAEGSPLKVGLVVGGVSINGQISRVSRGTDILVATPGRLLDLLDRGALDLSDTDFLVLDEADQMLDLGFIHALRKIAELVPSARQTMLFSATMPKQMNEIAESFLTKPVRIQVNPPGKAADKIDQGIHFIAKAEKSNLLQELLAGHRDEAAIVFVRTKHGASRMARSLSGRGFAADSIHGDKSQGQRERALAAFRNGDVRVLVATDVAARGLDIPLVRHVYNYDLPNVPDNYVHRIGRTARAGRDGFAVAFCAPDEMGALRDIQKVLKKSIPVLSGRPWEDLGEAETPQKRGARRGKGGGRRGAAPKSGGSSANLAAQQAGLVSDGDGGGAKGGKRGGKPQGGKGGFKSGGPGKTQGKPGGRPAAKGRGGAKPGGRKRGGKPAGQGGLAPPKRRG